MPINIIPSSVTIGATAIRASAALPTRHIGGPIINGPQRIPFAIFPQWHAYHLHTVANTQLLELAGANLLAAGFIFPQLAQFIRDVCRWGGYAGIAGRVLNQNAQQQIVACFGNTVPAFAGHRPASAALMALNNLRGLGTPSFASKHLRFLRPDICPVLDRLLSRSLGYQFAVAGYDQFSKDCCLVAQALNVARISLPTGIAWGAADVEMAMFACRHK
jgi:hypothetical protein